MSNQRGDTTTEPTGITGKYCEQPYTNKLDNFDETNFLEKHKLPKRNKKKTRKSG